MVVAVIRYVFVMLIEASTYKKTLKFTYKALTVILLANTLINILIAHVGLGNGFHKNANYWYWSVDQYAADKGVKCKGEWTIF